ncbi:MAG TPA: DUF6345 domain-containing protein [Saprospiraceae bacterium]|nr:DUF6345 domain-containing protein [Saprospiraceae bacterium]
MAVDRKSGAFWIKNYNGANGRTNLDNTGYNATGFCTTLDVPITFNKGDSQALARGIEDNNGNTSTQVVGQDDQVAERADIVFFGGHADSNNLYFTPAAAVADDRIAMRREIKLGHGGLLKWLVLDCCRILKYSEDPYAYCPGRTPSANDLVYKAWKVVFYGLRYLLGFDTLCHDYRDRGSRFATYLKQREYVREAWRLACVETEHDVDVRCAFLHPGSETDTIHFDKWTDQTLGPEKVISQRIKNGELATDLPFTYLSMPCGTQPQSCPS